VLLDPSKSNEVTNRISQSFLQNVRICSLFLLIYGYFKFVKPTLKNADEKRYRQNTMRILSILVHFLGVFIKPGSLTISALFETLMRKNLTFSDILQKVKTLFLPISIILRLIPYPLKFQKYKIEAPLCSFGVFQLQT